MKGSRGMKMVTVYEFLKSYGDLSAQTGDKLHQYSHTKLYVDVNAVKYNYFQIMKAKTRKTNLMLFHTRFVDSLSTWIRKIQVLFSVLSEHKKEQLMYLK